MSNFPLLPFKKDLKISPIANTQRLGGRNQDYFLIAAYGANLFPPLNMFQRIRTDMQEQLEERLTEQIFTQYFMGVYKLPNRKFIFGKQYGDAELKMGRATVYPSGTEDYTIVTVYALPKSVLRLGASKLCIAEGCNSGEYYSVQNEYALFNNCDVELEPIETTHPNRLWSENIELRETIRKNGCFYFLGAQHRLNLNLKADSDYKEEIINSLKLLKTEWGYNIDDSYIDYIQRLP